MPETEGLTIYIKEISESQANPNKITISQTQTKPLQREVQRIEMIKAGSGLATGKLLLNNDVITRVGDYQGQRGRQIRINNARKIGNLGLNIGGAALFGGPVAASGVALYQGYRAVVDNVDYVNQIRKDDIRADYKLDAAQAILINNSRYERKG